MYSCYLHGWSSVYEICPKCNPVETYATTSTSVPQPIKYFNLTLSKDEAEYFFNMQLWKIFEAVKYAKDKGWKE